jgi:hypothetical protein
MHSKKMSEVLTNLFGSKEKTRLLRFFLQNPEQEFSLKEIVKRNMIRLKVTKKELENLRKIKFVVERIKKGKKSFILNQNFIFYPELKNLIAKSNTYPQLKSLGKIKDIGNVKLAVISGAFINYSKSKADMIIVADGVSRAKLKNLMNGLEAEIGKEVDFALMTLEEFKYRLNMLDKFILEFLDGPHEEIINKIMGLRQFIANRK